MQKSVNIKLSLNHTVAKNRLGFQNMDPAPQGEGLHDRYQRFSFFGKHILNPWWHLRESQPVNDAVRLQFFQLPGQYF